MAERNQNSLMLGRRELILKTAGLFALIGFADGPFSKAFGQSSSTAIATPIETEGPYWVDEQLNRSDLSVDPTDNSIQPGFPLVLNVTVLQLVDGVTTPVSDAYVDLWHCNASGVYSDEQAQNSVGKKFLRGYQVTDENGDVRFLTIYPGWYSSRAVHIHCRVRVYSGDQTTTNLTTQFFFDDVITTEIYNQAPYNQRPFRDTLNTSDSVYTTLDCATGKQDGDETTLTLATDSSHAVGMFSVVLSPATTSCGGNGGGGNPPPGGGLGGGRGPRP